MPPGPRPRSRTPRPDRRATLASRLAAVAGALVLAIVVTGCTGSFDPNGPCTSDGRLAGAYPDLEAKVPTTFRGAKPGQLDSGRSCTHDGLGTLGGHGISELRYAGATWATGTDSGMTLAMFTSTAGPTLDVGWLAEFFEASARLGKNVESVTPGTFAVADGVTGQRVDVLNGESYQTVVVWSRDGLVEAALVADFIREIQTRDAHEAVVREAVDAWKAPAG